MPDQHAVARLEHIRQDYRAWCPSQQMQLSDEEIGAELAKLFRGAGIQIGKGGVVVGVSIKEPSRLALSTSE